MKFLKWFERKSTLQSPSPELLALAGAGPSGSLSAEQALRCTSVQAAVGSISQTVGSLPCHIFKRGANGSKDRDQKHPAEKLVSGSANPWTSAGAMRQQLVVDALCEGAGYGAVTKVGGEPREIHRLNPSTTRIDITSGEPVYIFNGPRGERRYAFDEVIHVSAPITRDGINGIAPVTLASGAIRFALELEQHGVNLFRNAARPGGAIKTPKGVNAAGLERLKAAFNEAFSGSHNTGKTLLFEDGMEWQQLTLNSVDAQYHELRGFAVAEIARAFRVPPIFLQDYGRATWGNSAEMGQQFLTFTLMPYIKALEFAYARALLTQEEQDTHYAEFIVDDLVRADISKRMLAYRQAIDGGFLTPNEARAAESRPPLPGGDELRPAAKPASANDNNQDLQAAA